MRASGARAAPELQPRSAQRRASGAQATCMRRESGAQAARERSGASGRAARERCESCMRAALDRLKRSDSKHTSPKCKPERQAALISKPLSDLQTS